MKKKNKRNLYTTSRDNSTEYSTIIKITVGVLICLLVVYVITAVSTGEIKFKKEKEEVVEASIQYEEIMAGEVLNRSDKEYYVLLFNFTDKFANYYLSLKEMYDQKDNSLPFYILDLEKKVNENIVVNDNEKPKEYPSELDELKVSSPTVLKIRNHTVIGRIVGRDGILKFFEEI